MAPRRHAHLVSVVTKTVGRDAAGAFGATVALLDREEQPLSSVPAAAPDDAQVAPASAAAGAAAVAVDAV